MFFLLATFVMVSLSMVKNRGISVVLPVANTSAAQDYKDHVTVSIAETSQLYLDKRDLSAPSPPVPRNHAPLASRASSFSTSSWMGAGVPPR